MPELQLFTAEPRRVSLPETNAGAPFAALRGVAGAIASGADRVLQSVEQSEVSDIQARLAEARSVLTVQLKERSDAAEPGDTEFAYKFTEEATQYLNPLAERVQTRAGRQAYEQLSASLIGDLYERAGLHQATLTGIKAKNDVLNTMERHGNTLLVDPTQFDSILSQTLTGLELNPTIPAIVKTELQTTARNELARSAVQGVIHNLDPTLAKQQLMDGQWDPYLKTEHKAMLIAQAEQGINAQRIEAERQKKLAQEQVEAAREQTRNDFMQRFTEGELSTQDVLDSNLEAFGDGSKKSFLDMLERKATTPGRIITDIGTKKALFNRIHLPDGTPNKIVDEAELYQWYGRGIDDADLNFLRGEVQMRKTSAGRVESDLRKQFLDTIERQVSTTNLFTGKIDPIGDENFQRFLVWFESEYKRERDAGTPAAALLDPDNPKYLGKYAKQFIKDPITQMREMADKVRNEARPEVRAVPPGEVPAGTPLPANAPPPRKPGETPEQYLKRIKEK